MRKAQFDAALELAWELEIYAYDAYKLECARWYRTPLMTLDIPLQRAATKIGIPVIDL